MLSRLEDRPRSIAMRDYKPVSGKSFSLELLDFMRLHWSRSWFIVYLFASPVFCSSLHHCALVSYLGFDWVVRKLCLRPFSSMHHVLVMLFVRV
jgi:hypothetical protein